jgi:hypothetical protein
MKVTIKKFLKISTSWKNWELGIFKLCISSVGIIAGSLLHEVFTKYIPVLLIIFLISGSYLFVKWFRQFIYKKGIGE